MANKITIKEIRKRFAHVADYEETIKADLDVLYGVMQGPQWGMYKPIKVTRWLRFKNKMTDYKQRTKDIWTILSGGDIHKDCDYY